MKNLKFERSFDLTIPIKVWQTIMTYARHQKEYEITGCGTVIIEEDGTVIVDELFLPEQTAMVGQCDWGPTALHEIVTDLIIAGEEEKVERMHFRWHSHGDIGVFFSERDIQDIREWQGDWVINLVVNLHGEYVARVDYVGDVHFHQDVNIIVGIPQESPEIHDQCASEINNKVRRPLFNRRKGRGDAVPCQSLNMGTSPRYSIHQDTSMRPMSSDVGE